MNEDKPSVAPVVTILRLHNDNTGHVYEILANMSPSASWHWKLTRTDEHRHVYHTTVYSGLPEALRDLADLIDR